MSGLSGASKIQKGRLRKLCPIMRFKCHLLINTLVTNELSHHYHYGESTFIFRGIRSGFKFLFFNEFSQSKQNSPRWDAAFCGVTSKAILFEDVLQNGCQGHKNYELCLSSYLSCVMGKSVLGA